MTVSRLRAGTGGARSFGRARVGRLTLVLLTAFRFYAVAGVAVAVYTFITALR
jgi:hypothetical protein